MQPILSSWDSCRCCVDIIRQHSLGTELQHVCKGHHPAMSLPSRIVLRQDPMPPHLQLLLFFWHPCNGVRGEISESMLQAQWLLRKEESVFRT